MKFVVIRRRTYLKGDKIVGFGAGRGLTTSEEIRAGTADGVLDNVREETRKTDGDGKRHVSSLVLDRRRTRNEVVEDKNTKRNI